LIRFYDRYSPTSEDFLRGVVWLCSWTVCPHSKSSQSSIEKHFLASTAACRSSTGLMDCQWYLVLFRVTKVLVCFAIINGWLWCSCKARSRRILRKRAPGTSTQSRRSRTAACCTASCTSKAGCTARAFSGRTYFGMTGYRWTPRNCFFWGAIPDTLSLLLLPRRLAPAQSVSRYAF